MTEFTSEFIAELKNIVSKATPTPYYFCVYPDQISENETHPLEGKELKIIACPGDGNHIFGIFAEGEWVNDYFDFVENNAEYIVIACNNLPKALDHIEQLQKRVEELEATISNQSKLVYKFKNMASDLQSENDFLKNNPEAEKYYYQKWVDGKQRIAELEQEQRWIPTSERNPHSNGLYDVWITGVHNSISAIYRNGKWNMSGVTHWRCKPQPPQESE